LDGFDQIAGGKSRGKETCNEDRYADGERTAASPEELVEVVLDSDRSRRLPRTLE
jgi:hypothetical protein